jgi:hypothetical protein
LDVVINDTPPQSVVINKKPIITHHP